jgi:hypothetical protein
MRGKKKMSEIQPLKLVRVTERLEKSGQAQVIVRGADGKERSCRIFFKNGKWQDGCGREIDISTAPNNLNEH